MRTPKRILVQNHLSDGNSDNPYPCYTMLALTPDWVKAIKHRIRLARLCASTNSSFLKIVFSDYRPTYFNDGEAYFEENDQGTYVIPRGYKIPDNIPNADWEDVNGEVRVDLSVIIVTERGIRFEANPKHCDWNFFTDRIPATMFGFKD